MYNGMYVCIFYDKMHPTTVFLVVENPRVHLELYVTTVRPRGDVDDVDDRLVRHHSHREHPETLSDPIFVISTSNNLYVPI